MSDALIRLLKSKRVIVSCGAGGVGKTTVSASLSAYAARLGLRVLVVTIDPSKRLAEALGVTRNAPEPVAVELDEPCTGSLQLGCSIRKWCRIKLLRSFRGPLRKRVDF